MFLKDFNQSGKEKIAKVNKLLKEEFNVSLKTDGFPSKEKLEKLVEHANSYIVKIKGSHKKFQLEPEYAKFLGIRDICETMLNEGMYAESPAYKGMKEMVCASVEELMDSGYTMDEACGEVMNRYRMDNRFAYDDQHVLPIVIKAAKDYMESCGMKHESVEEEVVTPETDLSENLLAALAKECGVELSDTTSYDAIEEKLNMFAQITEKSRDAVVGFLSSLEEDQLESGIKMFGAKVAEANAFVAARRDAIAKGEKKFKVGDKEFDVTGDTEDEKEDAKESSMFDDIIDEMIVEEVADVEQAEVIMAVRALADDIQDHVEEIGRMMNESLPAIADQMRSEMGAQAAATFADSVSGVLNSYIEASKGAKSGVDQAVMTLTGEEAIAADDGMGLGDTGDLGDMDAPADPMLDEPALDINEPAAAGPEEEPLGRAPVEA
jgi:hypothetical protein